MNRRLLTTAWLMLLTSVFAISSMAQTVTVQVNAAGGLWDALEAQGITDFTTVKNLTVTGTLGNSDFQLIKNQLTNLESVDFSGTNITEIPSFTFGSRESLKAVRLPENFTNFTESVFGYCSNLESVSFGNQPATVGEIVFPASLRSVQYCAFTDCHKLTKLDFSACTNLGEIGAYAFRNLYNLTELLFPSQGSFGLGYESFRIYRIWDEASQQDIFKGLETLTLTKAVTGLDNYCLPASLKTLYVESSTPISCSEYAFDALFENETLNLKVYIPKGSKRSYAIANGWSKVYPYMQEMGILLHVSGYGLLQQDSRTYTDGDVIFANQDGATTLKAVPEVGCELISVTLDGNAVDVAADGTFTIPAETTVGTLEVAFTATPTVVDNPTGGGLLNKIKALGLNPNTLRALVVTGTMNARDWQSVRNVMTALQNLDLSQTNITTVPDEALSEHRTIRSIVLPTTVTRINGNAFNNCPQLKTVQGYDNVEEIGDGAFRSCTQLSHFPFGDKIRSIGSEAFNGCRSLPETLVMPASLNGLGWNDIFNGSSIRSFDLSQCSLGGSIGNNSFGECTSLLLPENGDYTLSCYALKDAHLTELRLPAAVNNLDCNDVLPSMLERLYVSRTEPIGVSGSALNNIDKVNCTLYVPAGAVDAYIVANGWAQFADIQEYGIKLNISGYGSVQQGNLTYSNGDVVFVSQGGTVTLQAVPEASCELISVTFNGNAVNVAADGTFTIPAGTTLGTLDVVFTATPTLVDNPNGGELKNKLIAMGSTPATIRALKVTGTMNDKDWNFVMSSMPLIEFFDISETNVTAIPESALQNKEKLTTVHLPSTVVTINCNAFRDCNKLTTVDGCENVKEIKDRSFSGCPKLSNFPFGNNLQLIESGAFEGCTSLPESLVMPASLTSFGWDNMFNGSSVRSFDLSQCTLGGNFAYNAFGQCTSLLLPEKGDYQMSEHALEETKLTELRLPAALSYIHGDHVFPATLKSLYVSRTEPIGIGDENAFANIDFDQCTLFVPVGSVNAYKEANGWQLFTKVLESGFKVKTGGLGIVKYDGKDYADGENFFPPQGTALTMQIVPSHGYDIATLKVGGTAMDYADDGTFVIPETVIGGNIEVTFTKKQLEVAITMEGNGSYTIGEQTYTAATTLGANGGDVLTLKLQPASGSFVKQVTINGEDAILKNGGLELTTDALDVNTTIVITFSNDATSIATVTFLQEGYGTVSFAGETFEDGATLTLVKGKSITLSFAPDGDSNFQSLLVNDADVMASVVDNTYALNDVTANTMVKTTFYSPNMITVENPNGGELKDLIAAMGSNARTLRALKVIGKVTNKDWNYIRNSMSELEIFDISQTDVKNVPESQFQDKDKLTTVHLPSTVTTIYNYAFYNCQQLVTVDGCEKVKEIHDRAFGNSPKLTNFPFGNEIQSIGSGAFEGCSSLPETLVMPASLNGLGWDNVFNGSSIRRFDLSQCTLGGSFAYNTFGECTSLLLPEKGDYQLYYQALKDAKLTELRLPAALSYMYGEDVLPTTLERLYVSRSTPFEVADNNSFRNLDLDLCTLYVPRGAVEAYSDAPRWAGFTKVKEYGLQVTVGEQGKVRAGNQTLMGTSTFFPTGSTATFEIIPNVGWHTDVVKLDGTDVPFENNQFTLSGDQLNGTLAVDFAVNKFNLQLQIAGNGKVKLGSLEYAAASQTLAVDSLATLNFTLEPAEGQVVSAIAFNGQESVVQNGGTTYVTPAITADATLAITFGTAGAGGNVATYTVTTGEGGTVEYKNTTLLPQTTIQLPKGQNAVFAMKPEQYYEVDVVNLNGQDVTGELDADRNLTIENVDANATLEVTFRVNSEITVVMEDAGNLTNMLSATQKQNVTKLTVKGPMWDQDFYTMRDEMPQLRDVDLWDAQIDYIPYQAFSYADWGSSKGKESLTSVRLPESIRNISDWAFTGCVNLKEVNFTELVNLESISTRAFGWTALNVVDLSQTKLTYVGSEFCNVKNIENIKLPKTITTLYDLFNGSNITEYDLSEFTNLKTLDNTFSGCKNLVRVTLPEGLTSITSSAFNDCTSLTTINFPKSLETIGSSAFNNTKIKRADLSGLAKLQAIESNAFSGCGELEEVLFPTSLQRIDGWAFYNCPKLSSIDLSKTQLKNISDYSFHWCQSLGSVKMPKTLETIGSYAFANDYKLGGVLELGSGFTSIGEYAFGETQISVIKSEATTPPVLNGNSMPNAWEAAFVPEGYADVYKAAPVWEDKVILDREVHAEVTVSFEGNLAVDINEQAHVMPATVTHLKVHGNLGPQDFAIMRSNMTLLYDLDMEDANVSVIPENAFLDKKVLMNVKLPASLLRIEHDAFRGCSSLKGSLVLPNGLTFIGWGAFQGCSSLEEVVFNQNLEAIQGYAFEGCSSLAQELTLPRELMSLGERTFANCTNLYGTVKFNYNFYMFMGSEGYGSIAGACFENCSKIEAVDLSQLDFFDEIPYRTFADCRSLTTVLLPPELSRIDNEVFAGCSSLYDIEFPNSLQVVDDYAFYNCSSLRSVNLSDCEDLGTVGSYAFNSCSSLETVYLPKSLNWIREYAFADCRKLANLTVEALHPADLGEYVFRHVHTDRCVLSIPTGTFNEYLSAAQWGEFVSMRKNIDVTVGEGANLYFLNGDPDFDDPDFAPAHSPRRRASAAEPQGAMVKDGSSLYVQENEKALFMLNPDENVEIAKVLFNGQDVTDQMVNGTYQTPSVTDASSFEVQVNVVGDIHVKELRLLDEELSVKMGENRQLRFAVYPTNATNKAIEWSSSNEEIATVSSDGVVTGVKAGRVEVTAKTIDGNFVQKCQIIVISNNYWIVMDNAVEEFVENNVTLSLALHNESEARDIQFDVCMPEGVRMDGDRYGGFGIGLSERANGHEVVASHLSDGSVRVIVYSPNGNSFQDGDGELLTLPFVTGEEVGDFDVMIKNIHISGPDNFDFAAPNHTIRFNLKDYPLGDSNGNGEVTINDAVFTVDYILENYYDRFVMRAGDVNKDNQITVADVTGTVDIILERVHPNQAPRRAPSKAQGRLYMNDLSMTADKQQTVGLQMENADGFIAFQCDIALPVGMKMACDENDMLMVGLSSGVTSGHVISARLLDNGVVRLVVMSPDNENFSGLETNIVNLTVSTDDTLVDGSLINISNIRLIRNGNDEYLPSDASAIVHLCDPTDIDNLLLSKVLKVRTEGRYLIVESSVATVLQVVSTDGISRNLKIQEGENRFFMENAGVYVIRGKKFFIK